MKKFAVHRLSESARATLARHFLALPVQDRSLRFGMALAPTVIAAYVDQIDLDRDAVLGVHDERNALIGVAHVAIEDDQAELALSVLPRHRRRGIGSALFRRAIAHARIRRMPKLIMHCLTANVPIMRMAQKFGMVVVENGRDADAFLDLQPASSTAHGASRNDATDTGALCCGALVATADRDALESNSLLRPVFRPTATITSRIQPAPLRAKRSRRSNLCTKKMEEYSWQKKNLVAATLPSGMDFSRRQRQSCSSFLSGCIWPLPAASHVGSPDAALASEHLGCPRWSVRANLRQ